MNNFNWSRAISVLSFIAFFGALLAPQLEVFSPGIAFWVATVSGTIGFFTERVQGGASKI